MDMKKLYILLLLLAINCPAAGKFVLSEQKDNFSAVYNGVPLIVNEGFTPGWQIDRRKQENAGSDLVLNAWGCARNFYPWRREVSTRSNGNELELSFQVPVYAFNDEVFQGEIHYYMDVPLSLLENSSYVLVTGRGKNPVQQKGKLTGKLKDGAVIGSSVRQIAFSKPGLNLVFDLNPSGIQDIYSSYTVGSISGMWKVARAGNCIRFSVGTNSGRNGGLHTSKAVIYEGTIKDNTRRHAQMKYSYISELPAYKQLVFGAVRFGKGKIAAGTLAYDEKRSFGWVKKGDLKAVRFYKQGALYGAVKGSTEAVFRQKLTDNGLYLVTMNISADKPVGAMDLSLNGRVLASGLKVPARTVQNIIVPIWVDNNIAEFKFNGNWSISQISFQRLLANEEDYSIRRGFWRSASTDYPAPFYHNAHYAGEPEYKVALSSYPLPDPSKKYTGRPRMLPMTTAYGKLDKQKNTMFSAMIGSWGTGNAGTFLEFSRPGAVERNVKELHANQINMIMFNGMLARHTFADVHRERLHKVIGNYVKAARTADNIFIDHIDYSMLWNTDSAFRKLVSWTDRLQQTIDSSLPSRGRCMTNPLAVRDFQKIILEHIRKTGIDGLMVDECVYMGKTFCGCAECRKSFTLDTGWELPADELSTELHNPRSPLWRAWQEWRRRKIGEFWVSLRHKVNEYRKDFIFIGYTTHYGLTSDWAACDLAGDIFNYARAWDMVGTEIMPRNIFANARAVNSLRKAFSLFGRGGEKPVMGLVYATDWKIKYFGWAVNNLNGQLTWETRFVPCPAGEVNYRIFTAEKGNMDLRKARSAAKVALLFSETSRNMVGSLPAAGSYRTEILGTSQILSDLHIDHDFISEADLNAQRLEKYSVLIIGNSSYLADSHLAAIRRFAEAGGTVAASYMAGVADEYGNWRKEDFIGSLLGWKISGKMPRTGKAYSAAPDGKKFRDTNAVLLYRQLPVVYRAPGVPAIANRNGSTRPAVITASVGQGKLVYYPGLYGAGNCINELMVGKKYLFKKDPVLDELQKKLLSDLTAGVRAWEPVKVPEKVFTAAYYQDNMTVLHFLNAANWELAPGTTIPYDIGKNPFPAVDDIVFEVPYQVKNAYAVSPDYAGRKPVKVEAVNGRSRITLAGNLLKVYTLVYLEK